MITVENAESYLDFTEKVAIVERPLLLFFKMILKSSILLKEAFL